MTRAVIFVAVGVLGGAIAFVAPSATLTAQAPQGNPAPTAAALPRLPNGRPNFQGVFRAGVAPEGEQAPPAGRAGGAGRGGGGGGRGRMPQIPYAAAALPTKQILAAQPWHDRSARCMPNMPRDAYAPPYPQQIVQDGENVVFIYEYGGYRIIPTDGSQHPDPATFRSPFGDSRGRWEGDTLVVDVTNFPHELMHQSFNGDFTDVNLHLVERYSLLDANTVRQEIRIEDPTVYTRPWTLIVYLRREAAGESLMEHACLEGERAAELMKPAGVN